MPNLEELLQRLTAEITQTQEHYVYYNKENKRIHKISPVFEEQDKLEVFSIESDKVEPILKGINKLDDFFVFFDYTLKKYSIAKKVNSNFSNLFLEEITTTDDADLTITIDKNRINFAFDNSIKEHVETDETYLTFVVTEVNNPYRMYETMKFKSKDLFAVKFYEHQLTEEQIKKGVSIYTNRVFDKYSLKV